MDASLGRDRAFQGRLIQRASPANLFPAAATRGSAGGAMQSPLWFAPRRRELPAALGHSLGRVPRLLLCFGLGMLGVLAAEGCRKNKGSDRRGSPSPEEAGRSGGGGEPGVASAGENGGGGGGRAGAGDSGAAGDPEHAGGSRADGGAGGVRAVGGVAGAVHPASIECGDAIRDPLSEACDDGSSADEDDSCSNECTLREAWVLPSSVAAGEPRWLGSGPHPVAATEAQIAMSYAVDGPDGRPSVWVAVRDGAGALPQGSDPGQSLHEVSLEAEPAPSADPIVVALPDDRFAVVWADLSLGDLDVVLQVLHPELPIVPPPLPVNEPGIGAQHQPDAVWTGEEFVIAWTDDLDLMVRRFSGGATPLGEEEVLAATGAIESSPTLAAVSSGWAAAWRAGEGGLETIQVRLGAKEWSVGPHLPGAAEDRPALTELDADHLLLVFTEGTAPDDGPASVGRLRHVLLDVKQDGPFEVHEHGTLAHSEDVALSQRRPALASGSGQLYLTYETQVDPSNPLARESFLQRLAWVPSEPGALEVVEEIRLSRNAESSTQRNPGVGVSSLWPTGAVVTVWEEHSLGLDTRPATDLAFWVGPIAPAAGSSGGDE